MIFIQSKNEGFRRAGVAHSKKGKEFADGFFTPAQLVQLTEDPMLSVEFKPDSAPPEPPDDARFRKTLEVLTNDKLKADCDYLEVKYPANVTKKDLVDLILANTSMAPEE